METFLLLFVSIFLPFGWFILRALRYTKETVGVDSPLYRERTYQFSAFRYFGNFTRIILAFLLVEMVVGIFMLIRADIQPKFFLLLMVLFFSAFACYLLFFFYFDWQYWIVTRDILLTFDPTQSSITVSGPTQHSLLTPENVIRIEQHLLKVSNPKNPFSGYGYYLFYTSDGRTTLINNIFFSHIGHIEFIERIFHNTNQSIVWDRLPRITDLAHPENLQPPNFGAYYQR